MTPLRLEGPLAEVSAVRAAGWGVRLAASLGAMSSGVAWFGFGHDHWGLVGAQVAWVFFSICLLSLAGAGLVLYTPEKRLGAKRHVVTFLALGLLACAVFQAPAEAALLHLI